MVEMYGPSSSGKTALATLMMINAQKAGGVAGFMDHESACAHALAHLPSDRDAVAREVRMQERHSVIGRVEPGEVRGGGGANLDQAIQRVFFITKSWP